MFEDQSDSCRNFSLLFVLPCFLQAALLHNPLLRSELIRTPAGQIRMLGRFFNFLEKDDLVPPLTPTWRQWSAEPDVRLDYRVAGFLDYEFWCVRLEATTYLPIGGLDTAGHNCRTMDEMNLLCLDYSIEGEPSVIAWNSSFDPVEVIAQSFEVFLSILQRCPEGGVSRKTENF